MSPDEFISRDEAMKSINKKGRELLAYARKQEHCEEEVNTIGHTIAEAILSVSECKVYKKTKKEQTR